MTARVRGRLRHHRAVLERAQPAQHRHLPEHDRSAQRGDVHALHRLSRRRQRRHDADGAQLELRPVVRDVPRDPAEVRPARRVPTRAVRSADGGARPRSPRGRSSTTARSSSAAPALPTSSAPRIRCAEIRAMASASGYVQPDGERRSYLLVDGAQLVPSTPVDVSGARRRTICRSRSTRSSRRSASASCTAGSTCCETSRPFLYGGDMIAQGQVFPDRVAYNALPWKFGAGTPNILGTVISAQALRLLVDLARSPRAREVLRQRPSRSRTTRSRTP